MKIIHILECWGNAGTERYVTNLTNASACSSNKYEFAIINEITHEYSSNLLPGRTTNFVNRKFPIISLVKYILKKRSRDTICHLHLYSSIFPVALLLKICNIKFIVTYHVPLSQWSFRHRILWILSGCLANKSVAVSTFISEEFKKYFTTEVIFPPVWTKSDIRTNQNQKLSISIDKKLLKIVCVGRLENKQKDWLTLIDAISRLPIETQDIISVVIIGGGPDRAIIQNYIAEHALGKVIELKGYLDKDQVFAHLETASISVLPSKFEGFGMSAVETMSRGILTITSNFPASSDFIKDGITGYNFQIGDAQELARVLEFIIHNDNLRNKIAERGRVFACGEFSDVRCALKYNNLYDSI